MDQVFLSSALLSFEILSIKKKAFIISNITCFEVFGRQDSNQRTSTPKSFNSPCAVIGFSSLTNLIPLICTFSKN